MYLYLFVFVSQSYFYMRVLHNATVFTMFQPPTKCLTHKSCAELSLSSNNISGYQDTTYDRFHHRVEGSKKILTRSEDKREETSTWRWKPFLWIQKVPTLVWGSSIHWNGIAMVLTFLADRKQTQVWRLIHSHTTKKKQTSFLSKSWRIFPGRQIGSIYSLDRVCFLLHSYSLMSGWIVEFHVVGKNEMH